MFLISLKPEEILPHNYLHRVYGGLVLCELRFKVRSVYFAILGHE